MQEDVEIKFMKRCLELAIKAEGFTYPNPLVGSVIVHEGKIIGEGFHLKSGSAHAEVNAINSVISKDLLPESTLYVNLEPCSHTGKTPPCADLIIAKKIPEVVIGSIDTSDKVSGKGIQRLKDAGIKVITGVLEKECRYLNRRFFTYHEKKRPYITLKWAQSSDGFLDIIREQDQPPGPTWITGKPEKILVHRWRACEQAILAGAETIRKDNPQLNVREWSGISPLRLILSNSGLLIEDIAINKIEGINVIFTRNKNASFRNAEKVLLKVDTPSAVQVADYLYKAGIQSLMIEGGYEVLSHFIAEGMWDEARIFSGNQHFMNGVKAPDITGASTFETFFSSSSLKMIYKEVTGT